MASGHAAQLVTLHALMQPGDEFVAAGQLYGGSISPFNHSFNAFGWQVKWADIDDIASFDQVIGPKTKAIFIEFIANPGGRFRSVSTTSASRRGSMTGLSSCRPFSARSWNTS